MKLKQGKNKLYCSNGRFGFIGEKTASGIEIEATRFCGMKFKIAARTLAEANRKIAEFVSADIAETHANNEIRTAERAERQAQDQAQPVCAHVWVDQPITDRLNIAAVHKCSICGEQLFVPRSN